MKTGKSTIIKSWISRGLLFFLSFRKNVEGSVLPLFGLTVVVLTVAIGAGADYTNAVRVRLKLQGALDAAVLAGAVSGDENERETVAREFFQTNLTSMPEITATVTFSNGPGRFAGTASAEVKAWFIRLLGVNEIPVGVSAAASVETAKACLYVLNELESSAFKANGSGIIDMPECEMHVHSRTSAATWIDSRNLDTKRLCVAGNLGGNARPWPTEFESHCDVSEDPLAGTLPVLSDDLVPEESCVPQSSMPHAHDTDMVFRPGTYCGNFPPINSNVKSVEFEPGDYVFKAFPTINASRVTFGAGNYVFKGVTFQFNSSVQSVTMGAGVYVLSQGSEIRFDNQMIFGAGVTIYLADEDSAFRTVQGSSHAALSAPKSGPFAGILYYEAPDLPVGKNFILDGTLEFDGIVYLPSRNLHLNGSGRIEGTNMILAVDRLSLDGKISLSNDALSTSGSGRSRLLN